MKLRQILVFLFCLVAIAPVSLFWLWPHSHALESEIEDVRERHLVIAKSLSRVLSRYHTDLTTIFDLIAVNVDSDHLQTKIAPIFENLSIRHVCIADIRTGRVIESLQNQAPRCPDVIPDDRWTIFKEKALETNTTFTGVLPTKTNGNIIYALRRADENLIIGAISTRYIAELGRSIKFGHLGHAAIVDQYGQALSHPRDDWQANRFDMSRISAVQEMLAGNVGVEIFYSPALKADMIAGYSPVEGAGWGIMVPQPLSELESKASNINFAASIILLAGLAAAVVLAWFASNLVIRPIERFVATIARVGNGDLDAADAMKITAHMPLELREANESVSAMAGKLRNNMRVISQHASYDSLTLLPNRRRFFQDLEHRFARSKGDGSPLIVGNLDLDGFKAVNDLHGHSTGDKLLCAVADRLHEDFGDQIVIYRLGGDEFALILPKDLDDDALLTMGLEICTSLSQPFELEDCTVSMSGSVGFARIADSQSIPIDLFEQADYALYQAKYGGRDTAVIFSDAHFQEMNLKMRIQHEMRKDAFFDELSLVYQPIFDTKTRAIVKIEALARWKNPLLGSVQPSMFIPIAEHNRLINDLTLHQLTQALTDMRAWPESIGLSFNLSANDIAQPNAGLSIGNQVLKSGVDPRRITFEITETAIMQDVEQARKTAQYLQSIGTCLSIDDFGTGNTSLSHIHHLAIDSIKIDRSFVMQITDNPIDRKIVKSLILMCNDMDLECVAEGVETEQELQLLTDMGCTSIQGYLMAQPMDRKNLTAMLATEASKRQA